MITSPTLLSSLQSLEKDLEDDLRRRVSPDLAEGEAETSVAQELDAKLRSEYAIALDAGRTANAFEIWREEYLTQVAVAWVLACVFVRFLEDNDLIDTPLLSGPDERRQLALDQHELFFQEPDHKTSSDREYLLHVFTQMEALPAASEVFDREHNPLWSVGLSGDGATKLLAFWQRIEPETGALDHDFTDTEWSTRFLGDLYQDLSEGARKKYALLQTPEFVEEFILDRTLTPAIESFGYQAVRLIDPTCGSGHFLLGAFHRLLDLHAKDEPGTNPRELVRRVSDQVYGVDLNPFAVAIARFRLMVEGLKACGVKRLSDAPAFAWQLAVGDSLLHGSRQLHAQQFLDAEDDPLRHVYETEDAATLKKILGQSYHAVVGNPPYITVKDKALNQAYRDAYSSCHRQYSLGVPFTERFFDLARSGSDSGEAGFVGMITANSFMKREFGKKLIEKTLPRLDLTHVIDTSGAYIPGHGTPTVIMFGRNRRAVAGTVRTVMGIRGEPSTPEDANQGLVWQSIVGQVDAPGSESEFVSVSDYERDRFKVHPWSIGGGGAGELKELIEAAADKTLGEVVEVIGRTTHTGEDDAFYLPAPATRTRSIAEFCVPVVLGTQLRDYDYQGDLMTIFPYEQNDGRTWASIPDKLQPHFWRLRRSLRRRRDFGQYIQERGLKWYEHSMFFPARFRTPLSIAFAFVATHNHFVLDHGGKVFNRSAPVIKLPADATEEDHLALLALLNSSLACFWMQQIFHNKGGPGGGSSKDEKWHDFFEHDGTKLKLFPLPKQDGLRSLAAFARAFEELGERRSSLSPDALLERGDFSAGSFETARLKHVDLRQELIALQEELDWAVYSLFGLLNNQATAGEVRRSTAIDLGYRPFELELAEAVRDQGATTRWFEVLGANQVTAFPNDWPENLRRRFEQRREEIQQTKSIRLIEKANFKRRWEEDTWDKRKDAACRAWLLSRLESSTYWSSPSLISTSRLSDLAKGDAEFMQVSELYTVNPDFDVASLVRTLVEGASVPAMSACRYKAPGLRKRIQWERTWELQREEDAIDARTELPESDPNFLLETEATSLKLRHVGEIPVPPKYTSGDFQKSSFWSLRGKLDVPKERFVSFPHCEREADPSPVVAWAGWDDLELSQAIAAYYLDMKEQEGWATERLVPLLAALQERIPWLKQWHNELDSSTGVRMGEYFESFVQDEIRELELTPASIKDWSPPRRARAPRKKAAKRKAARR